MNHHAVRHLLLGRNPCSLALTLALAGACSGWTMDYGTPAAQFEARDAAALAAAHLGEKVSVRGQVLAVDTSDPDACVVTLEHGVTARFGRSSAMAAEYAAGETAYIDGIVRSAADGALVLDPAMGRDPTASFEPQHR